VSVEGGEAQDDMERQLLYPCALMVFCMGDATMHSSLLMPNEKAASAVQTAVSLSAGYDCWVGNKLMNAFEYMGQNDSLLDMYNSFISAFTRGLPDRVLSYRARALFDSRSIESYKVFYVYPVLIMADAKQRKRIRRGVRISSEAMSDLMKQLERAYRLDGQVFYVVPLVMHRCRIAQAIEANYAQSIVAMLRQGMTNPGDLPSPVDPLFKLVSAWPDTLPMPVYDQERGFSGYIHLPDKYRNQATLDLLKKKGWTVANE